MIADGRLNIDKGFLIEDCGLESVHVILKEIFPEFYFLIQEN